MNADQGRRRCKRRNENRQGGGYGTRGRGSGESVSARRNRELSGSCSMEHVGARERCGRKAISRERVEGRKKREGADRGRYKHSG